jgi:Tol biopolymer transport system component
VITPAGAARAAPLFALLMLASACARTVPETPLQRLHYLATATQFGPVSFRDPLGALSPDGRWLAYAVQQHLYLQPVPLGPLVSDGLEAGVILHLTWSPDSRRVILDRRGAAPRWRAYELESHSEVPLWRPDLELRATADSGAALEVRVDSLRQLTWSRDGSRIAGVRVSERGSELWSFTAGGDSARVLRSAERLSFPVFAPDGHLACLSDDGTIQVVSNPCGKESGPGIEAYGPLAFSWDGSTLYYAAPDSLSARALALFAMPVTANAVAQLTSFARDAYAPSVAEDGSVLFTLQSYRTVVGVVSASGGPVHAVATFQSETPSWDPAGTSLGITFGAWRRVADDFHYPDIAQDIGSIPVDTENPATQPARIVEASPSEDQSLAWSPNGQWIAYHSHKNAGDDLWLLPADLSAPARRLTSFGRGAETGWPRWSPNGNWLAFDANARGITPPHSVIYVMGMDQQRGVATGAEHAVSLAGFSGDAVHAEWLPDSDRLAVLGEEAAGHWALLVVPRPGGPVQVVHRWASEHRFAGLAVSPDGRWAAFIAPAGNWFQLFRIPLAGGAPEQLTFDPTNKSQPAWSPDGRRIALTLWDYAVQFWILR